jgi:hypothetical protein
MFYISMSITFDNIDWKVVIKKEAREFEYNDLGVVPKVRTNDIITKVDVGVKETYCIPTIQMTEFHYHKLRFNVIKDEAKSQYKIFGLMFN